jgi:hypothetical protein
VGTTNMRIRVISFARSDIGMKSSHGLTFSYTWSDHSLFEIEKLPR